MFCSTLFSSFLWNCFSLKHPGYGCMWWLLHPMFLTHLCVLTRPFNFILLTHSSVLPFTLCVNTSRSVACGVGEDQSDQLTLLGGGHQDDWGGHGCRRLPELHHLYRDVLRCGGNAHGLPIRPVRHPGDSRTWPHSLPPVHLQQPKGTQIVVHGRTVSFQPISISL